MWGGMCIYWVAIPDWAGLARSFRVDEEASRLSWRSRDLGFCEWEIDGEVGLEHTGAGQG